MESDYTMSNAKVRHRMRRRSARAVASTMHRRIADIAAFHAERQCRANAARYEGHSWSLAYGVLTVHVRGTMRATMETVAITGTVRV